MNHSIHPLKTSEISKLLKSNGTGHKAGSKILHLVQQRERESGGARRDRTADLLRARQALSQLSYGPSDWSIFRLRRFYFFSGQSCTRLYTPSLQKNKNALHEKYPASAFFQANASINTARRQRSSELS